ncbi:MAG: hypothetical protein AAFX79_08795 [Planctomycetota bacterium]
MTRRRAARRLRGMAPIILIWIAGGVLCTIASSWALQWVQFHQNQDDRRTRRTQTFFESMEAGTRVYERYRTPAPDPDSGDLVPAGLLDWLTLERYPGWQESFLESYLIEPHARYVVKESLLIHESGWPTHAMAVAQQRTAFHENLIRRRLPVPLGGVRTSPRHSISTGIEIHAGSSRALDLVAFDRFALPLMPIWPGFAINTAFYAAVLATMWYGQRPIRILRWNLRGRCLGCGYDVRNLATCPECGRPPSEPRA